MLPTFFVFTGQTGLEDARGVSRAKNEKGTKPYPGTFSLRVLPIIWIKCHPWMYSQTSH